MSMNKNLNYKNWIIGFVSLTVAILAGLAALTIFIDPYFHFHGPINGVSYVFSNQRYMNDGIEKHFDYDSVIIGSSMSENFKPSEADKLFGGNFIKLPFPGASYKEINNNLETIFDSKENVKTVIRALDYNRLLDPADEMKYDEYPTYLYDNNIFNDIKYIFNTTTLLADYYVIRNTLSGNESDSMDSYGVQKDEYGYNYAKGAYFRPKTREESIPLSGEDYINIDENIYQNIIELADAHPETDFYLFFTPYSILYWDSLKQDGTMDRQLEAEKYIIEKLLPYDNIHLFSFFSRIDIICNLDNYKDPGHYSPEVCSQLLEWMAEGRHEFTEDNYIEYCNFMKAFYKESDYEMYFPEEEY